MERTEKEKMLAGENYNPSDPELTARWHKAKRLMRRFNDTDIADRDKQDEILNELLGSKGDNVMICGPLFVDYGENIYLGNNVEFNMNCVLLDCNRITIGDNSGLGPNVQIYAVGHPVDPKERLWNPGSNGLTTWRSCTAPVTIGKNVWIGGSSIILQGVTIGDGTTIGAGSVVSKDIPANCLAVGNPCKVIKYF